MNRAFPDSLAAKGLRNRHRLDECSRAAVLALDGLLQLIDADFQHDLASVEEPCRQAANSAISNRAQDRRRPDWATSSHPPRRQLRRLLRRPTMDFHRLHREPRHRQRRYRHLSTPDSPGLHRRPKARISQLPGPGTADYDAFDISLVSDPGHRKSPRGNAFVGALFIFHVLQGIFLRLGWQFCSLCCHTAHHCQLIRFLHVELLLELRQCLTERSLARAESPALASPWSLCGYRGGSRGPRWTGGRRWQPCREGVAMGDSQPLPAA